MGVAQLVEELMSKNFPILLLGDGIELCQGSLIKTLGPEKVFVAPVSQRYPRAANVAVLALQKWKRGEKQQGVVPVYLREPG